MIHSIKEEDQNFVQLLNLHSKLKSLIYKATSIECLLNNVCDIITENAVYEQAWILFSNGENDIKLYPLMKIAATNVICHELPCYKIASQSNDIVIINNKEDFCSSCIFKTDDNYITFSIPLKFKDAFYGTFSVSLLKEFEDNKQYHTQFIDIANDLSYAIYNLFLEKTLKAERKKLTLLQHRNKSLIVALPDPVIYLDLEMNITFVSDKARIIFAEIITVNFSDIKLSKLFSKDEYERLKFNFAQLINQNKEYDENIYHVIIKKAKTITIKLISTPVYDGGHNIIGVVSIVKDYSEIENRESELAFYEKKFSTIFNEAPTGISIIDPFGYIVDVNEMECKIIGFTKNELIGKKMIDFFSDNTNKYFDFPSDKFFQAGVKEFDAEMIKKNGEKIIVRKNTRAINDQNGNLVSIIMHSKDYTEIFEAQNRIKTLSKSLNQVPSIVTITDLYGNITYVNKQFEKITGYTFKEVKGKNARILRSDLYSKEIYKILWERISDGKDWKGRFHNVKKNGERYWEHALISPFIDDNGKISGYIKSGEDISSLVEIENSLMESNDRYQKVFEVVPIPIVIYQNGVIIDANQAAIDFAKVEQKEQFLNTKIENYIQDKDQILVFSAINKMKEIGNATKAFEIKFFNSLGELRDVSIVSSPFMFKGEELFMAAFMDITEKNNWLHKLRESESKFKSIFNTNPNSVTLTRLKDGMFYEVNNGFCRITGYTENEVIGKTSLDFNIFADYDERAKLVADVDKYGLVDSQEMKFRLKNGTIIVAIVSARVIMINGENVLLMVAQDISKRKMMEKELINAKLKAEENDKLKSAFLANMSHEIRNPMNAIIGFSDLLKDEGLSHEEQISYIDIIQSKGDELLLLINDIIDISKIESGVLEVECDSINVYDFLKSLKNEFTTMVKTKSNDNVVFRIDYNGSKDLFVNADLHRLNQIFYNLISNAIKFTYDGEISVAVDTDEKNVIFMVSDTGIGIPEENLESIFDRFSQVNNIKDALIGGTGLGLSITKSLLEMMDSSITVTSKLESGSTFIIKMPKTSNTNNLIANTSKEKMVNNINLQDAKVAIVDDDEASMAYLSKILKSINANFKAFSDIDKFRFWLDIQTKLDFIIIDTKFLNERNLDCFNQLKELFPKASIIGVSANIVQNNKLEELITKLDAFVSKPYTKADMLKAIAKFL